MYKDNDAGGEFSVPADWTQEVLSQEREFLDAKFKSNKDAGLSILYGSTDVWAELSSSERAGLSRSDLNSSIFSLDEIAEAMGVTQSEVSKVTYGGNEYFEYVQENAFSFSGINFKTTITGLTRFENGYAYTFQFSGDKSTIRYKDFEALLASVTYPRSANPLSYDGFSKFSASNIMFSIGSGKKIELELPFLVNSNSDWAISNDYLLSHPPRLMVSQYPYEVYLSLPDAQV